MKWECNIAERLVEEQQRGERRGRELRGEQRMREHPESSWVASVLILAFGRRCCSDSPRPACTHTRRHGGRRYGRLTHVHLNGVCAHQVNSCSIPQISLLPRRLFSPCSRCCMQNAMRPKGAVAGYVFNGPVAKTRPVPRGAIISTHLNSGATTSAIVEC